MKTADLSARSAFLRPADPFGFLQSCKKGPGAWPSHRLSDLSLFPLIKFKPLIRWETVFFLPLTWSLFALRICHPGNFTLLGEGSLQAFEVGREEIRQPRQARFASCKGTTRDSGKAICHSYVIPAAKEMGHYRSSFICWLNRPSLCVMYPRVSVICLLKVCYSLVDTSIFPTWLVYGSLLPAKKNSGPISVAICFSLEDQVRQGKLEMTTEK